MPNIMTVEQMQKGSLNLDTLEAWVEGAPNTTITTPNGRVVPTMSTAVADLTTDGIMQDDKTQRQVNTELDTKINSVSGGYFKAFDTLANLNAATVMTTGQVAKVMSDSTSNNGDYYYSGTAWIKGYDALTDAKSYTDSYATVKQQALQSPVDFNSVRTSGIYHLSTVPTASDLNLPELSVGVLIVYVGTWTITSQIYISAITAKMYYRSQDTNGVWQAWHEIVTSDSLSATLQSYAKLTDIAVNAKDATQLKISDILNTPINNSVRIKLMGDSITWGLGSHTSVVEPRTGQLSDPRNTTNASSKTWANLLRQWIAKVYGNGSSTEDKPGSAYTQKTVISQWRDIYKQVKMTTNFGAVLTDSQKLVILDVNPNFESGTSYNVVGSTFGETYRPNSLEFEMTGDNLTVMNQSQQVGDANDIVEIYVDNVLIDSFNYYAASNFAANKTVNFSYGKHTIKLINKATNASSYVVIGGFKTSRKVWVINEGIIGSSTKTWLDRNIFEGTLDGKDDIVIMMLGTNDRGETGGVEDYKKRLNDCIDKINTLSPNSKVVLMSSTFADTDAPTSPYKFDMGVVDKVIASVAKERNLMFISNYKSLAQAFIDGEVVLSDGLHLNDLGNKYYYETIRKKLFDY